MGALRLGLVGCGRAGATIHARALAGLAGLRVVAVADPVPERVAAAAAVYGARPHTDHRALLAAGGLDALAVCAPPRLHAAVTRDALDGGLAVYVEKPLAADLAGADAIVAAGGRVAVGHNLRGHRLVRAARRLLAAGALGPVRLARGLLSSGPGAGVAGDWRRDPAAGGGVFAELAVHHVDLLRYLLADEPLDVDGRMSADAAAGCLGLRFAGGTFATLSCTFRGPAHNTLELVGERASLRLDLYASDGLRVRQRTTGFGPTARLREAADWARRLPAAVRAWRAGGDFPGSYVQTWRDFLALVRGERGPACSAADGRAALQVVLAGVEAARTGQRVRLGGGDG